VRAAARSKDSPAHRRSSIGSATLDLAVYFYDGATSFPFTAPSGGAEILGKSGIDIQVSIYRTCDEG
jgi:hypothetical protein